MTIRDKEGFSILLDNQFNIKQDLLFGPFLFPG
jgi:hypothetical protein